MKEMYCNKNKTLIAFISEEVEKRKKHRYFRCNILKSGTWEILQENKIIAHDNLIVGNFSISNTEYRSGDNPLLYTKLRNAYDNLRARCRTRSSYSKTEVNFGGFVQFYLFLKLFLQTNGLMEKYLSGDLTIDKDAKSWLKYGYVKKEYSQDTVILLSMADNFRVRTIINSDISDAEKEEMLLNILDKYGYNGISKSKNEESSNAK